MAATAQITLNHNVGTDLIDTGMYSCERDEGWSRVFTLADFGVGPGEQFYITSGQVGLLRSNSGAWLQFTVYSIDEDFPEFFHSQYPRTHLGSRSIGQAPDINGSPQIIQTDFDQPIIVPAGTERILVTLHKVVNIYHPESGEVVIAGTAEDTGASWYTGCEGADKLAPTTDIPVPVPEANFYINVTGNTVPIQNSGATTRLSHNVCDDIIETDIYSCSSSYIYWARAFTLSDFGISTDEEFTIRSGQVGITKTGWLPEIRFNIYRIDDNFPASFSEADLIGSSQFQELSPYIDRNPHIIEVQFDTPIVVPAGVERILVEVHKGIVSGSALAFIAGSSQDNDESWQRGCLTGGPHATEYVSTADIGYPDANFYINVTGDVDHISNNFNLEISNVCSEFLKEFRVTNPADIASVIWDFGDPASGAANTSTQLSPYHDFTTDGVYNIRATVTATDGSVEVLEETIDVVEPPEAYGIDDVYACEDDFNSGIASSFDLSGITARVLGGQTDKVVTFVDGQGKTYSSLPNPFTNTVPGRETIRVRVAHMGNTCCYSETSFELVVIPLPEIASIPDLSICDAGGGGVATFDLQPVAASILSDHPAVTLEFLHEDGTLISPPYGAVPNSTPWEEEITLVVTDPVTQCSGQTTFWLRVGPNPVANPLPELFGCDDNGDGISEFFDTSQIESTVVGEQTGMEVTYYDTSGVLIPGGLPNPYTNFQPNQETITVRVTNPVTNCYSETPLVLTTSERPYVAPPFELYACDQGGGIATFDNQSLEMQLTGGRTGLRLFYSDAGGNPIASPFPDNYQNITAWSETIFVRVESEQNSNCYATTQFQLEVISNPEITLESRYFLCNLEPSLTLEVPDDSDSYQWRFQDGSLVSESASAIVEDAGDYTLTVGRNLNGIYCESSHNFNVVRSVLPAISEINVRGLSDANFIEILATGDGDFEYSIDQNQFQDSPIFTGIPGGVYTVVVRDKGGCGQDSQVVVVLDYPRFFTPNNDGYNDLWHIEGMEQYPEYSITIFDRYGKMLYQLSGTDAGWDGIYRGTALPESDYWFIAHLDADLEFSGHFTLKR